MGLGSKALPDRAKILEIAGLKDKTVLDIGTGSLSITAARDFNCQITSIDISVEALKAAETEAKRQCLEHKISFEQEDAADLPYPDWTFHTVISYGALHHNSS
jgi:cyclopropane fatty-acyl-phospholipid synthase-like methyltransferase